MNSTLPVGQTFIWHRHALPIKPSLSPKPETLGVATTVSGGDQVIATDTTTHTSVFIKREEETSSETWKVEHTIKTEHTEIRSQATLVSSSSSAINVKPEPDLELVLPPSDIESKPVLDQNVHPDTLAARTEAEEPTDEETEPTEEYSRAIPAPDRAILLRQSSKRIWFVSVLPENSPDEKKNITDSTSSPRFELEQLDRNFLMDYFRLRPLAPESLNTNHQTYSPPSSPLSAGPGDLTVSSQTRSLTLPLPYQAQYEHWKSLDPLLLGKALDNGWLPRGVRVVRQEGWECLIS
jgi:hypothetical protein